MKPQNKAKQFWNKTRKYFDIKAVNLWGNKNSAHRHGSS